MYGAFLSLDQRDWDRAHNMAVVAGFSDLRPLINIATRLREALERCEGKDYGFRRCLFHAIEACMKSDAAKAYVDKEWRKITEIDEKPEPMTWRTVGPNEAVCGRCPYCFRLVGCNHKRDCKTRAEASQEPAQTARSVPPPCPDCKGKRVYVGFLGFTEPCKACGGKGTK